MRKPRENASFYEANADGLAYAWNFFSQLHDSEQVTANLSEDIMNEAFGPFLPEQTPTAQPSVPLLTEQPNAPATNCAKRLLACNPFYLASAALLLFGIYRISIDPSFLSEESAHLFFNFSALQVYELLLVSTAIFLAGRRIWYDSILLVGLENLLVLVPFILVSQAGLIQEAWVWVLCLGGACIALARFASLQHFIRRLNAPFRLGGIGLVMLVVNTALPIAYRILHQSKVGTRPDWGAAYYLNEFAWLLLLPMLCVLLGYVPFAAKGEKLPGHKAVPLGLFTLWLLGTAVHLYSLGYVYDFALRPELLAPALWTLCWVVFLRASEFWPSMAIRPQRVLCVVAFTIPMLAWKHSMTVLLTLVALNGLAYGMILWRRQGERLALHLLLLSLAVALTSLPPTWMVTVFTHADPQSSLGTGFVFYGLFVALLSRHPKAGLLGGFVLGVALSAATNNADSMNLAFEGVVAFLLLHSLRWEDKQHPGAGLLRGLVCVAWVVHAFLWTHFGHPEYVPYLVASLVLGGFIMRGVLQRIWQNLLLPTTSLLVMLAGPGDFTATKIQTAPVGLLAVLGSFLLLLAGTAAALLRNRRTHSVESQQELSDA